MKRDAPSDDDSEKAEEIIRSKADIVCQTAVDDVEICGEAI